MKMAALEVIISTASGAGREKKKGASVRNETPYSGAAWVHLDR